ncbi:MAG: sigma-54-dependent Fis family transcriptional regulator [Acidobacteria bacterium]|nr:MAG: sigma-54-dependent Fis family transcriptional regulator [Acidobacteriota bacterium]
MTAAIAHSTFPVSHAGPIEHSTLLNLLIVSPERPLRDVYREAGCALGYSTSTAGTPEQALYLIDSQTVDAVVLDVQPPIAHGLETLQHIKARHPQIEVIVVTSCGTVESAVQAMKAGAYDYLTQPFSLGEFKLLLENIATHLRLKTEKRILCGRFKTHQGFGCLIGRTTEIEKLYRLIRKASQSSHPVLILGESGTGKEVVARAIHYSGPFRDKPFIPVDCGSLVPTLIESELFGHTKGAFTGASQSKDGLLTIAEGGTVFLDEIGELAIDLQAKLLRALQEKEIRPVGSTKSVPINVRILAATNHDLEQAVAQGLFRLDLFYRLNVLSLRVPPLRERREDIPLLAAKFLEQCSPSSGRSYELSDEAMQVLIAHDWPGNVRELENCIERCCAMSSGPVIHTVDLPSSISGSVARPAATAGEARVVPLSEIEKQTILKTIAQLKGDKMLAAKLLGIGKTTLYRKLKEYQAEL